jgi:hypothetical protein
MASMHVRTIARFQGGFQAPTEAEGPSVLEERLRPVAEWLHGHLAAEGIDAEPPEWFDFEYQVLCRVDGRVYELGVSFDYLGWSWFELGYARTLGFLGRLVGRDESKQMSRLSEAVDRGLRALDGVTEVRWYDQLTEDPGRGFSPHPVEHG